MLFERCKDAPIIPRTAGTFYSVHSANPDVLFCGGRYHMYFRGQGDEGKDQIGVGYCGADSFDGVHWEMHLGNPVICPSVNTSDFDSGAVLDPGTVLLGGRVYLYYTGHSQDRNVNSGTGLAVSDDGTRFEKVSRDPVVEGIAPEAVIHEGKVHLFVSRPGEGDFFQIHCYVSDDGVSFCDAAQPVVLAPSGVPGDFDSYSVTTVRVFSENGWYYMTYAGCDRFADYPGAIGLARSRDLVEWERYPGNPIFTRGEAGTWDEGAVWFPTVHKHGGAYYLWYEGGGTGMGIGTVEGREASRRAREENYGGYGGTTFSQIGLAMCTGTMPEW